IKLNNLKFMLLTGILLMDILAGMEFDLFVPSFPELQAQFHLTPYWIFVGIAPLLYMNELGVSLHHFGLYQGSLALVFAIGSVIYALVIKSISYTQNGMLTFGVLLQALSIISLVATLFSGTTNPLTITLSFIPFIIAQIIPGTILYPMSLHVLPEAKGRIAPVI